MLKPSDEACLQHFKEEARSLIIAKFNQSAAFNDPEIIKSLHANAESIANDNWESTIHINDYLLFKHIKIHWIDSSYNRQHVAILNSFF
jgi:hypothetical protein